MGLRFNVAHFNSFNNENNLIFGDIVSCRMNTLFSKFPLGLRYMLLSALGFSIMSACVKLVSQHGIPVLEIVAFRALVSLILSTITVKHKKLSIWGNNKPWLIARGVVGAFALMCVYYALATLPLAEATMLQYFHPIFTALLAFVFLKERLQLSTALCIACSVLGLSFIIQPHFIFGNNIDNPTPNSLPTLSIIAALCGAFGSAVAYIIVKKLSRSEDPSVIIFYFPLIALPLSLIALADNFVIPSLESLSLLLLVGVFTQVGQIGLTKAMQTEDAGKATAFSYIQVLFSIILGVIIFSEVPTLYTLLGGGLIIIGALINVFFKR